MCPPLCVLSCAVCELVFVCLVMRLLPPKLASVLMFTAYFQMRGWCMLMMAGGNCVCVCVREKETDRQREREREGRRKLQEGGRGGQEGKREAERLLGTRLGLI
uniref:Uncharacterized protein n=1 Tax=Myripristis murdjan TaxID=586833 RepID=A0A668AQX2_9TELE